MSKAAAAAAAAEASDCDAEHGQDADGASAAETVPLDTWGRLRIMAPSAMTAAALPVSSCKTAPLSFESHPNVRV